MNIAAGAALFEAVASLDSGCYHAYLCRAKYKMEVTVVAGVISVHETELCPGVSPEEFERFMAEAEFDLPPGHRISFLKGREGQRNGK